MELQRHHTAGTSDPCAGWDLVQRDWTARALDEPRSGLAVLLAGVRRVLCAVLRCEAAS
jgi:hypothetical protein